MSPVPIPPEPVGQAVKFLRTHFAQGEWVSIATRHSPESGRPFTFSTSLVEKQCAAVDQEFLTNGHGGKLVRINPVNAYGSGRGGAHTDSDVTQFRATLIEGDMVPIMQQLAILAHLPLPISALTLSGGKSVHAVVGVVGENLASYKKLTRWLASRLVWLGFDPSTTNPSRLTRLPGATRCGGPPGSPPVVQELIYLNANPTSQPILH